MMTMESQSIPVWVNDAVIYQIFPERFANGDRSNDPVNVESWGGKPTPHNFFGGDLRGIMDHISHLEDLGVNTIYLNPIFSASTNHKYNVTDYKTIDPAFGTNELFNELVTLCHSKKIRIILDGVFNHVGINHFAFNDVVANGKDSKYASWFNIFSYPVNPPKHPNYECWWGIGSLPKLMVQNPAVKEYLFDVARQWTPLIDGWRLDVPNELPHAFWKEWRSLVRSINPECYIVGEIWDDAAPWLQGDEFDAVMNYRFRTACIDFFAHDTITPAEFDVKLAEIRRPLSDDQNHAAFNLLGSHDTERFLTMCEGNVSKMKLAVIFQLMYQGVPEIYYGDEIGMDGGKDPDCRRCMVWNEAKWNTELYSLYKQLLTIRKKSVAVRRGEMTTVLADDTNDVFVFSRTNGNDRVYVCMNRSSTSKSVRFGAVTNRQEIRDELSGHAAFIDRGTLSVKIQSMSAMIFIC